MPTFLFRKRIKSLKDTKTPTPSPVPPKSPKNLRFPPTRTKSVPDLRGTHFWTKQPKPPLPAHPPRSATYTNGAPDGTYISSDDQTWVQSSTPPSIVGTEEPADLRYTSGSQTYTQPTSTERVLQSVSSVPTVAVAYVAGEESEGLAMNQTAGPSIAKQTTSAIGSTIANSSAIETGVNWVDDNLITPGSNTLATVEAAAAPLKTVGTAIATALDGIDDGQIKAAEKAVTTILDHSQDILKMFDAVKDIHPAVGAVVAIFKIAIELELKRRDNDRKIGALRLQRYQMMEIVLELTKVQDPKGVAEGPRVKGVLEQIKKDVQDCSNGCEAYLKVKFVAQILKAQGWNAKLADFGTRFQDRKKELQEALAIHASLGIDAANRGITNLQQTVNSTNESVNMLLLMDKLKSPKELKLMALIKQKGGPQAVMGNDDLLAEIANSKEAKEVSSTFSRGGDNSEDLKKLKKDLTTDIDAALQKNRAFFDRKFKAQEELLKQLGNTVVEQSDRVINVLLAGPGDKIKDKSIREMWQENKWKSSVKTSRFVLSFRDYLIERFSNTPAGVEDKEHVQMIASRPSTEDEWALAYITFVRLQPINEAFDDDASGFVSVKEVNQFTESRPKGWSLPHWIAFWAAGWHLSLHHYVDKVTHEIMPRLLHAAKHVLPANRAAVDRYLGSYYFRSMESVVTSVHESHDNDSLLEKFQSYVDEEEERLNSMLKHFEYEIDAHNTLLLITGEGRLERFIMPLIYLILRHHCKIITLCTTVPIDEAILHDAARTWETCHDAMTERLETLVAVFKQQHLSPDQELKRVAYGIFEHIYSPQRFIEKVTSSKETGYIKSIVHDTSSVDNTEVICHPLSDDLDLTAYEELGGDDDTPIVSPGITSQLDSFQVSGFWDGFYEDDWGGNNRMCLSIKLLPDGSLTGFGSDTMGAFHITGTVTVNDPSLFAPCIVFRKTYKDGVVWDYRGSLTSSRVIEGDWGIAEEETDVLFDKRGSFSWERRSILSSLRSRPTREMFQQNRGSALWSVAASAVREHLWTWSFFKERRDIRLRFLDLYSRHKIASLWSHHIHCPHLTRDELSELEQFEHTLGAMDTCLYVQLAQREIRRRLIVHNVDCASCGQAVLSSRTLCLDCKSSHFSDTVDLCDQHVNESVVRTEWPMHTHAHFMLRIRRYAHYRTLFELRKQAGVTRAELEGVRMALLPRAKSTNLSERNTDSTPSDNVSVLEDNSSQDHPDAQNDIPTCSSCWKSLTGTHPYWCCIECKDPVFFCTTCETAKYIDEERYPPGHEYTHPLLRIPALEAQKEQGTQQSVEDRLTAVEQRLMEHTGTVDLRLSRLEHLLQQVLTKMTA